MTKKQESRQKLKAAIAEHLSLHGPSKWDELQVQFPDVSRATFFRYVKEVREEIEEGAAQRGNAALKIAQQRIKRSVETPEQTQQKLKAHLPVAPSPAVIADLGTNAVAAFDFMAYFTRVVGDTELVRNAAVVKNEDGTERVKNPVLLDDNIRRRLQVLETWLHSMSEIYNLQKLQELYNLIIDEVGKADPDVQQAVVARLRALNNRRGLTIDAVLR